MKTINFFICGLCVVLCHACASTSEPVKYYSLRLDPHALNTQAQNQAIDTPQVNMPSENTPLVNTTSVNKQFPQLIIIRVHLAKILQQDGIVTQIGKNEMSVAHFHRWAEPLDESIEKLLAKDLNIKTRQYYFSPLMDDVRQSPDYTLRLTIDKFDISDDASVNVSGQYWLLNSSGIAIHEQSFDIKQQLKDNGYPHAVEKFKQALLRLADEILPELDFAQ